MKLNPNKNSNFKVAIYINVKNLQEKKKTIESIKGDAEVLCLPLT